MAVAEHENIKSELIPRIATGFCGGMGHTGGTCGAVSGGIMGIGLTLGRNSSTEQNDACYQAVQAFLAKFSTQFGSLSCPALIGVDLGTLEGQAAYEEERMHEQCSNYVGEATRMVIELNL